MAHGYLGSRGTNRNTEITFNAGTNKELVKMSYSDFEELAKPQVLPVGVRT